MRIAQKQPSELMKVLRDALVTIEASLLIQRESFARLLGISPAQYYLILNGTANASLGQVERMAANLGISVWALLGREDLPKTAGISALGHPIAKQANPRKRQALTKAA